MADVIKSYLVSLSSQVDKASFDKFASAMQGAEKTVAGSVGGIVGNFLKFQVAGTTAFASVGFGLIAYIDKLAQADLKTTLLAQQNMMSVQQYRAVSTALDTLGVTLDDVFFGTKEVQERFHTLIEDQKQLAAVLGPGYEKQQQMVRDVTFQLQRLEVKGEYFGMAFVSQLLEKLGFGKGGIILELERLNDFVLDNMPKWSDEFSTDIIPVLEDFWQITKQTAEVIYDLAHAFTTTVGLLAGDNSLETQTTNFRQFATAVEDVVGWIAKLIEGMILAEQVTVGLAEAMVHGLKEHKLPDFTQHVDKNGNTTFDLWGDKSGAGGTDFFNNLMGQMKSFSAGASGTLLPTVQGNAPDNARQIAIDVSKVTGVPANLIYGQMGFETGGFKSFAGTNNYSGIKIPGTDTFQNFQSVLDYEKSYESTLNAQRYVQNGIRSAVTADQFAHSLKTPSGTYYGKDSESNYAAGVDRYSKGFGTVTIGTIVVNSAPSLTPEQHQAAIKKGVREGLDQHVQQQMAELNGAYQ